MNINRTDLLNVLKSLASGLSSKEILEQSIHFIFDQNSIFTDNNKIHISIPFEHDLQGAIQADKFMDLLKKLKNEEIEIEQVKVIPNELQIKAGTTSAGFQFNSEIKLRALALPKQWHELPVDFSETLKFCAFSTSRNIDNLVLCCLHVEKDSVYSCDNYRLTKKTMSEASSFPMLIVAKIAKQLIEYHPHHVSQDESWLHFQCKNNLIFSCRKMDLTYPDVTKFFDVQGQNISLPKQLSESIQKAEILATEIEDQIYITLIFQKGWLVCKGENHLGWIHEKIKMDYTGQEIQIKVHPRHFIEILEHLDSVILGPNSLLFQGKSFVHVISLVS